MTAKKQRLQLRKQGESSGPLSVPGLSALHDNVDNDIDRGPPTTQAVSKKSPESYVLGPVEAKGLRAWPPTLAGYL